MPLVREVATPPGGPDVLMSVLIASSPGGS
jgi:hypothetical protein